MTARLTKADGAAAASSSRAAAAGGGGFQHRGVKRSVEARVGRLVKLLVAGGYPNSTDLAEALGTSRETIQRDLRFLRKARGLTAIYDKARHGYWLVPREEAEDEGAGRTATQLTKEELVALFIAGKTMQPLRGRLQKLAADSVRKIAATCADAVSLPWQKLEKAVSAMAAGVVEADVVMFGRLINAVTGGVEVGFDYHKLKGSGKEHRTVQPYHLCQRQDGWYLIAKDLGRGGEMRTFALQRMGGLEMQKTSFQRDAGFNLQDYLSSGFGVWSYAADADKMQVRIHFTGWAARVVPERQWHPTQNIRRLREDGSEIEFRAEVAGLEEITRWVLSHGRHARVLGPPELVRRVREELEAALATMD